MSSSVQASKPQQEEDVSESSGNQREAASVSSSASKRSLLRFRSKSSKAKGSTSNSAASSKSSSTKSKASSGSVSSRRDGKSSRSKASSAGTMTNGSSKQSTGEAQAPGVAAGADVGESTGAASDTNLSGINGSASANETSKTSTIEPDKEQSKPSSTSSTQGSQNHTNSATRSETSDSKVSEAREADLDAWSEEEVEKVCQLWKLSPKERQNLVELGERLRDVSYWKNNPKDAIRFLKARPKSVSAAETMFRQMVKWRLENKVDTILEDYEPPRLVKDYLPGAVLVDYDLEGDPIFAERIGAAHSFEMVHRFGPEHLIKHAMWIRETIGKGEWIQEYERKMGKPVCQILVVEDLRGLSMLHLDRQLLSTFQVITRLDQDNYPEVAKKLINVNAPFIFRFAWSLVKHFFDANVAAKIVFVAPGSTEKVLKDYVDLKVLPREIVAEGEGKAAPGLPQNFKGGPLPPPGEDESESAAAVLPSSKRVLTASDSSSVGAMSVDRQSRGMPVVDGDDSVSVLSHQSDSRLWKKKPVRTYIRDQQIKKEKRKEQEIQEIRAMAAKRIQPKQRSPSQQERLGQLRDARTRRLAGTGSDDTNRSIASQNDKKSLSEKVTDHLHTHGKETRFFLMTTLVSFFFVLLHPELLNIAFGVNLIAQPAKVRWVAFLQGARLLLYMLVCTVVHFVTCDVALVYAYNALDLGSKTGRQVKKFYSDNIRIVVAAISFGIFALSAGKALSHVMFSMSLEQASASMEMIWAFLSPTLSLFWGKVSKAVGVERPRCPRDGFNEVVGVVPDTCESRTSASEAAHRAAEAAQQIAESAKGRATSWLQYFSESLTVGTVDECIATWQSDAFSTARLFFSYTVVFLLVFLVLFNYAASSAALKMRIPDKPSHSGSETGGEGAKAESATDERLGPRVEDNGSDQGQNSAKVRQHHTENGLVSDDVSVGASSTASSRSRKRRLRLFNKRKHAPALGAVQELSGEVERADSI